MAKKKEVSPRDIHDAAYITMHRNRKMAQLIQDYVDEHGMSMGDSIGIFLNLGRVGAGLENIMDDLHIEQPASVESVLKDPEKAARDAEKKPKRKK